MAIVLSSGSGRGLSDDLEVTPSLPVGDGLSELSPLPAPGRREMVDEGPAEQIARQSRRREAVRGLAEIAGQRGGGGVGVAAAGHRIELELQLALDAGDARADDGRQGQVRVRVRAADAG